MREANVIIKRHDSEFLEDTRRIAQALWDTGKSNDPQLPYLRGMLDTINEYQHRGDET